MSKQINQTKSGKIREKRSDTLVKTIERKYNVDLQARSDMKLGNLLREKGLPSLSKLIKETRKD
ncbi:MAG: hypothetical protein UR96_C0003G0034 [candidate division WS6 bacterium GW2011_GWC1_36_11]|uniref:Uncharacterized protein n=3 Tax=Candidatus Dojkabacteria TaxID=74243 RepID=A0A0G0DHJ7_9BACT|nr:MAG: hypothetical protein UR96_C0003G0034 [candidate division WS6 bacterium GW2011_GWC1_36_11]KKQ04049.1 MAG: hypothetical protein US14_C0026G0010 [candidate division WS6 bacterium GW2011_WS6_36_26]KKQ10945.1 MAG: hypothetical protein US24_C0049G0007 [candidate division WS6 bacterium GW2011_GWC2_36_7]KKQ16971.1 MAG: hypothetical protein US29_C0014G0002 [candidate division WS6 bacterium GW2011_GWF1_36_8]HAM96476.1 hypothetical protein [Patescibacteria group bacterium]